MAKSSRGDELFSKSSRADELFPTTPSYFMPVESKGERDVRIYHVNTQFSHPMPPPPSFSFCPGVIYDTTVQSPLAVSPHPPSPPRSKYVSYEVELCHSAGLVTCPSCQVQVTTWVTYHAGTYAWLMCLVFILCGMVLGCCLIPFFVRHFKDTYHTCPHCHRVLHVHKRTCC